ncbi:hypothetical protein [Bosea sp. (in: a-proteobacteria)]|uniref:hypothetical protein n=1 Tax=Bosea sp. (in: a-proteobacteria) TaxID=1871050 RepID=UPI002FC5B820
MPTEPPPRPVRHSCQARRVAAGAALAALLAGCSPAAYPIAGRHPADATVVVSAPSYAAVSGAKALRPAEPKGWLELNRQVTPKGH